MRTVKIKMISTVLKLLLSYTFSPLTVLLLFTPEVSALWHTHILFRFCSVIYYFPAYGHMPKEWFNFPNTYVPHLQNSWYEKQYHPIVSTSLSTGYSNFSTNLLPDSGSLDKLICSVDQGITIDRAPKQVLTIICCPA